MYFFKLASRFSLHTNDDDMLEYKTKYSETPPADETSAEKVAV